MMCFFNVGVVLVLYLSACTSQVMLFTTFTASTRVPPSGQPENRRTLSSLSSREMLDQTFKSKEGKGSGVST